MVTESGMTPAPGNVARRGQHDVSDLVDDIDAVVWEADPRTFAFTFVSKGAERLLGYSADQWTADPAFWANHIHRDDQATAIAMCTAAINQGLDHEFEYRMVASDGSIRWVRDLVRVGLGPDGRVVRLRGVIFDETNRRRSEGSLRESEQRFRAIFESTAAGLVLLTEKGDIISANTAAAAMLGLTPDDLRDHSVLEFTHPDERAKTSRVLDAVAAGLGTTVSFEGRYLHRLGHTVTALVSGAVVAQPQSGAPYLVAQLHDISERKELSARLRQAQKLEAVGRLASSVAHDFNNMLLVVQSYAELLIADLAPRDPRRADLLEILGAARAGADLTSQLLAFSRQQPAEQKVIPMGHAIRKLERMLGRLVTDGVAIVTKVDEAAIHVLMDPGQLEQIIVNLVVNASDAMPEGGTLTIEARVGGLAGAPDATRFTAMVGRFAVLSVADTGIGMDAETRNRIFEPFFTTKVQGKGTGLGLATVYGIVKQNGGSVIVRSEPGQGAEFQIHLPLVDSCPDLCEPDESAAEPLGTETVLAVEDEGAVRAVTRMVLERFGYKVLEAPSAEAALEIAARHAGPIHLLLTDVMMPGMNGPELARRLSAVRPGVAVLFMSGHTDERLERQGIFEPGVAYIAKPFAPLALARKVRRAISGR